MAVAVSWSLKNISLLVGCFIFIIIWLTSRHSSSDGVPEWSPEQPMHHKLDWDLPDNYHPPAPPPKPAKQPAIPWAEAKFKADAEADAKRRKAEREKKEAEKPENKQKAEELFKKIAAEQQRALAEQAALEKANAGKLPFQADLSLDTVDFDTSELRRYQPHNWKGPGKGTIATYLSTPGGSLQEPYFVAAQQLAYRLLWDPRTKSTHTFTVFVAPHITNEQRDILTAMGALVRQLEPVESPADIESPRWKYQFAKLHMWKTDFARILFLDSDAFPMHPIDALLDVPQLGCKRDQLPPEDAGVADILCQYSFNAAPQGFQKDGDDVRELNVGVMVIQPNDSMHKRLLRNFPKTENWDTKTADQGYLSEMFKTSGPFPYEPLERKWNGFFPQKDERDTLRIVHEKLWMPPTDSDDPVGWAKDDFQTTHRAMLKFYQSEQFRAARKEDGLKPFE